MSLFINKLFILLLYISHSHIVNPCINNPCQNGGTCTLNTNNQVVCSCRPGFSGLFCTIVPFDPCVNNPCLNGGQCQVDSNNQAYCICQTGWSGAFCAIKDACACTPCKNGGTCTPASNSVGYTCTCTANFFGSTCESCMLFSQVASSLLTYSFIQYFFQVSPCLNNPCLNGGVCSVVNNVAVCTCQTRFTGNFCQTSKVLVSCSTQPCKNGATCVEDSLTGYSCKCKDNQFIGSECDIRKLNKILNYVLINSI